MYYIIQITGGEYVMNKSKEIKKVQEEYLTGEEERERIEFLKKKARMDEQLIFEAGYQEGYQEGIELGREIAWKQHIAKVMLEEKMPIETIMNVTKLSREDIEKLEIEE